MKEQNRKARERRKADEDKIFAFIQKMLANNDKIAVAHEKNETIVTVHNLRDAAVSLKKQSESFLSATPALNSQLKTYVENVINLAEEVRRLTDFTLEVDQRFLLGVACDSLFYEHMRQLILKRQAKRETKKEVQP